MHVAVATGILHNLFPNPLHKLLEQPAQPWLDLGDGGKSLFLHRCKLLQLVGKSTWLTLTKGIYIRKSSVE